MFAKTVNAIDNVMEFVYDLFKKVLWTALLTAVLASMITASVLILGYNVIQ